MHPFCFPTNAPDGKNALLVYCMFLRGSVDVPAKLAPKLSINN